MDSRKTNGRDKGDGKKTRHPDHTDFSQSRGIMDLISNQSRQ